MNYDTTLEIETAVANYFGYRRQIIVPNVWWGLGFNHECDMLVVDVRTGYAKEVEIKISRSDLKADSKKGHLHTSPKIKRLYFAVPQRMTKDIDLVPARAGILIVSNTGEVRKHREAKPNEHARPLTQKEQLKLAHLGTMRIWSLKQEIRRLQRFELE